MMEKELTDGTVINPDTGEVMEEQEPQGMRTWGMTLDDLEQQRRDIQEMMDREVLVGPCKHPKHQKCNCTNRFGIHYGYAKFHRDGTPSGKPTLLLPGAQVLALRWRLRPSFHVEREGKFPDHRNFNVSCTLRHIDTNLVVGQGMGSASTYEPKCLTVIERFGPQSIPQHYNPQEKIGCKRAFVCAILYATATGEWFTQDTEDMPWLRGNENGDESQETDVRDDIRDSEALNGPGKAPGKAPEKPPEPRKTETPKTPPEKTAAHTGLENGGNGKRRQGRPTKAETEASADRRDYWLHAFEAAEDADSLADMAAELKQSPDLGTLLPKDLEEVRVAYRVRMEESKK